MVFQTFKNRSDDSEFTISGNIYGPGLIKKYIHAIHPCDRIRDLERGMYLPIFQRNMWGLKFQGSINRPPDYYVILTWRLTSLSSGDDFFIKNEAATKKSPRAQGTGSNLDDVTQKGINTTQVYQNLHREKFGNWGSSGWESSAGKS